MVQKRVGCCAGRVQSRTSAALCRSTLSMILIDVLTRFHPRFLRPLLPSPDSPPRSSFLCFLPLHAHPRISSHPTPAYHTLSTWFAYAYFRVPRSLENIPWHWLASEIVHNTSTIVICYRNVLTGLYRTKVFSLSKISVILERYFGNIRGIERKYTEKKVLLL